MCGSPRRYAGDRESVRVMPAVGSVRTRTEDVARAVEAARLALEQHLRTASADTAEPLVLAHRALVHASQLLRPPVRRGSAHGHTDATVLRMNQTDAGQIEAGQIETGPHDLTRIRGIDAKAVEKLAALGITRCEQIAGWEPEDVRSIGQALDLGRSFQSNGIVDQARMLLSPIETVQGTIPDAVATWSPRPSTHDVGTDPVAPLTSAELAVVHDTLRRGVAVCNMRSLMQLVPRVARLVHVPIELIEVVDEAPWRPSPLMASATPIADAPAEPVTPLISPPGAEAARGVAPDRIPDAGAPIDVPSIDTVLAEPPVHVAALDRIAALDAEISAFGARTESAAPEPVVAAVTFEPAVSVAPKAEGPLSAAPRLASMPSPAEEADVTIKVRTVMPSSLLQPMPELQLRPKRQLVVAEPMADAPSHVSEAAVVIVKRRARERAAPDLEFYKRDAARVDGEMAS
jgi:predicted flap endonuclease-1-like 5' DNA nuclease